MKNLKAHILIVSLFLALLMGCQTIPTTSPTNAEYLNTKIFLVRHAEKTQAKNDPDLTEAGTIRARLLANMLADAKITEIHSSDYKRTLQTAAPLAEKKGLEVQIYDPRDLASMADKLRKAGGVHLVVGHSNTTPQLTQALGGDPHTPIEESWEYNRLYIVTLSKEGDIDSTLLRYGE